MKFYIIFNEMEHAGDLEREIRHLLEAGFSWKKNVLEIHENLWVDCQADYAHLPHESVGMLVDADFDLISSVIKKHHVGASAYSFKDYEDMIEEWEEDQALINSGFYEERSWEEEDLY